MRRIRKPKAAGYQHCSGEAIVTHMPVAGPSTSGLQAVSTLSMLGGSVYPSEEDASMQTIGESTEMGNFPHSSSAHGLASTEVLEYEEMHEVSLGGYFLDIQTFEILLD